MMNEIPESKAIREDHSLVLPNLESKKTTTTNTALTANHYGINGNYNSQGGNIV